MYERNLYRVEDMVVVVVVRPSPHCSCLKNNNNIVKEKRLHAKDFPQNQHVIKERKHVWKGEGTTSAKGGYGGGN